VEIPNQSTNTQPINPVKPRPANTSQSGTKSNIILILVTFAALGLTTFLTWHNSFLRNKIGQLEQQIQPQATEKPIPISTPDPTADWQTYINKTFSVRFMYPHDLTLIIHPSPPPTVWTSIQIIIKETEGQQFSLEAKKEYSENQLLPPTSDAVQGETSIDNHIWTTYFLPLGYGAGTNVINSQPSLAPVYIIQTERNNILYRFRFTNDKPSKLQNQILSTFQFTDKKPELGLSCGGWDTSGETICQCSGQLIKEECPSNTTCDSGTYTCEGECGKCCYKGIAENHPLPKCE